MKGTFSILSIPAIILTIVSLWGCSPSLPTTYEETMREADVAPNYFGATLPPNIAPLNFKILQGDASEAITHIHSKNKEGIIVSGWNVCFDEDEWHKLLDQTQGDTLYCDIYLKVCNNWQHLPTLHFLVANELIDPYITYRLIRPSYVTYEELTINERCLENFNERIVYENMRFENSDQGQCINCHMPSNWNRDAQSQFHIRQAFGGTVFIHGNEVTKVNLKTDSTLSAGVYPAWHPTLNLIAYSVNETGQVFHTLDPQKVEVIDYASDLILYDIEANTVLHIERTASEFESFPTWSPDGRTLYYISAHYTPRADDIDTDLDTNYDLLHYNIYARDFDLTTRRFGPRRLVFNAETIGKSASVPRVSPNGKYLLFTLADYGQFHIWHKSADLWILPLDDKQPVAAHSLQKVNSLSSESYHAWSSNGRWILLSSRRDDDNYTRLYISYFDEEGHAHKPFRLPQQSVDYDELLLRSYNAAEFLLQPVQPSQGQLRQAIKADVRPATYAGSALSQPESDSIKNRIPQFTSNGRRESIAY